VKINHFGIRDSRKQGVFVRSAHLEGPARSKIKHPPQPLDFKSWFQLDPAVSGAHTDVKEKRLKNTPSRPIDPYSQPREQRCSGIGGRRIKKAEMLIEFTNNNSIECLPHQLTLDVCGPAQMC